jgi:hypothetical protein
MSNLRHQPFLPIRRKLAGYRWLTKTGHVGQVKPQKKQKAGPARGATDRLASLWWRRLDSEVHRDAVAIH